MDKMRLSTREVTNQTAIQVFLQTMQTGYLGLVDGLEPYVIPLNYIWHNENIYFHGASSGRKVEILKKNNLACFTVSEDLGTLCNPIPAKTDTAYMSVILSGNVKQVEDISECTDIMQQMLNKYVPGYYSNPLSSTHLEKYRSSLGSKTIVFKLIPEKITGKENKLNEKMKFTPGRTIKMDL
ncbi:pyridoxamine 5'-phosphate oxidase family protein [Niallia sp. 03133]|uniref:pyridoxamine 5'-phosphate oxidase family protein n=1 Tax=Niallia sp. 03133 TaxID=3458060 RepID=UPI00404512C6